VTSFVSLAVNSARSTASNSIESGVGEEEVQAPE
jgi:hypothetical protein